MDKVLINGEPGQHIGVTDRGFQYGDGIFETLAVHEGKALWFNEHYQRLQHGCSVLNIASPDKEALLVDIDKLASLQQRAVIKIIVSRGESARGYQKETDAVPTRVVLCSAWNENTIVNSVNGIRLKLCKTPVSSHSVLGSIKHLNRLENVMARLEWQNDDYDEGLMCDSDAHVVEGIMSNIFISKNNTVFTPRIQRAGVKGIMRNWVLKQNMSFSIKEINIMTLDDVMTADEIFMSNSLIGLWPVREFNGGTYKIGRIYKSLYTQLLKEYPVLNV